MTILHTPRLVLRPAALDDLADWFDLDRQPGVLTHLTDRTPSRESVEGDLRARLTVARLHHGFGWFSILREQRFVGRCSVRPTDDGNIFDAEIGYRLRPEHWGQGLATEAAQGLVEYAFAELNVASLVGVTVAANLGSRRVLACCGMTPEAPAPDSPDRLVHRITLAEWLDVRDDVREQLHDLQARALAARDGAALDRLRAAGMALAAVERPGHWASSALVRQLAADHGVTLG